MKKLLVVDDEAAVRRFIRRALADLECEIAEASDGDEAVRLAGKFQPDVILLDMHMPRLDGVAALDDILAARPDASVIMLTGDVDPAHAKAALERGASDFLTKPIDIQSLRTSVESFLLRA